MPFDAQRFRRVLGHFATGVAVITAAGPTGPAGMVVSSFTSVSLEPPLVAFLPDKKSNSWRQIQAAGHFCVNILREGQEDLCARFAARGADKFAGVDWRAGTSGSPILENVMAWIDCELVETFESGDHYIAIGEVLELEAAAELATPLVFFQGGYGAFSQYEATNTVGHFDDIVSKYVRSIHAEYAQLVAATPDPARALAALLQSAFRDMETHRAAVMVLQNERDLLSTRPEFAYLVPLEVEIGLIWTGLLQRGVDEGLFRPDLNVTLAYRFIRDALFMAARWYRPDGPVTGPELAAHYVDTVLHGIVARDR
jgi:3-hydroxy-9,10-secoandrosta-1,3,5(10)-triene-9,17-dione monooxygenase reductase component